MAEGQLKRPSPDLKLHGLLTNKAVGNDKALVVVRDTVGFAPANEKDPKEQWTKLYQPVNDKEGNVNYAFVLLNDITGKAIKQPSRLGESVLVVDYKPVPQDHSLLWTETDNGNGFTIIHEYGKNNVVLDAQNGQLVVVSNYNGQDTQLWKFKANPNV